MKTFLQLFLGLAFIKSRIALIHNLKNVSYYFTLIKNSIFQLKWNGNNYFIKNAAIKQRISLGIGLLAFFIGFSASGQTLTVSSGQIITITSNTYYTSLIVMNGGTLIVNSPAILTIGALGTSYGTQVVDFQNKSIVLINAGASLVVNGLMNNSNNSSGITFNGAVQVNGNVTTGNGSAIAGSGTLTSKGTIIQSGSATIFGSNLSCSTGPCDGNNLCGRTATASTSTSSSCTGASVTLTATISSGSGTYQWQSSNTGTTGTFTPIAGAIGSSFIVSPSTTTYYSVVFTDLSSCKTTSNVVVVTVYQSPTASAGGSQTTCSNGTATVSGASATNGTIAWTHNGLGSITSGATTSPVYTAVIGDAGHTVTLTMTVSNSPCANATATYSVNVSSCARTWTGATSTDWNTNTNWTPTILPTSLDDVTIPNVTNKPFIASGATGNAKAITINASSSLTISSAATLNAYGSITNNSTSTSFTANLGSTVALLGNTAQTISGVATLYNATLNNAAGLTVSSTMLTIKGKLLLTAGVLTTNSNLTIDIDNGGNIGYTSGDVGTVSGTVKVFRAINSATTHYISCPLDNVTANDLSNTAQVINPTTTKTRLFKFDNATYTWVGISSLSTVMAPSNSYSMWFTATTSVNFTGTYTHSASYNYTGPNVASRFMFVSNPYPSTLDWDAASGWTKSGVNNAIYFWNPTTNSYASYVNGAGTNGGTQYIPAMNSFFVAYNGTTPATATVGMTNSVRSSTYAKLWRTAAPDETVRLTLKSSIATDETVVRFNADATDGFDGGLDAYKMMNSSLLPSIYTTAGTDKYSINSISNVFARDTIPVMIKIPADGNYVLSINASDPAIEYILVDKKLGTETAVSTTDYPFTALKTDDIARFELQLRTTTTTGVSQSSAASGLQILSSPNGFLVRSATANNSTIEIMDMTGKVVKVLSNVSLQNGDNFFTPGLADGAYLIRVNMNNTAYVDHVSIIK